MTKSTITREESIQAVFDLKVGYTLGLADIEILKRVARMALVAMDSEPVELPLGYLQGHKDGLEWAAQLAEANHPETGDWLYDDPIELAKAIRKGPDRSPVQPVADSEPDRNPVLAYADSYRDMAKQGVESVPIWSVITDLERNIAPLYRHAQQPVVPEEKPIPNTLSMYAVDAVAAIAEVKGWNACRAAMLAAAPQSPGSEPATVPGEWIPVSERMPDREVDVQVYCPDKKEQMVAYLERNELDGYFRFATWRTGDGIYCQPTHWMQLPAGPQEAKGE
ncbi:Eaa1 [Klebsiella pneumoniae]|nr:Eaa1 [Klebsiella pneumoniae]SXL53201.1 Eaa1 [Klebsiella pneumoniae]SXM31336.1 Eaa1 [Klebsiella pneumoniae]SXN45207.1 Eaa1 [Klebsiella pneumoniae]